MGQWNDLLIKGVDDEVYREGYSHYHVRMGQGFLDALEGNLQMKEAVENDSRLEHGVRMLVSNKITKRTINLTFNIFGNTEQQYQANKAAFEAMLYKGIVHIKVNDTYHPNYYHLVYTGKSVSYHHSYSGRFGTMVCQFTEPNPTLRTASEEDHIRVIGD